MKLFAVWFVVLGAISMHCGGAFADNVICDGPYALCTSAPCVPDPRDPQNKSICECVVEMGKSFGNSTCEERKAKALPDGTKTVVSTYSFEQVPVTQLMSCPSGKPWSNCLDYPCTVDPLDTKRAVCSCKIERQGEWVTYGGSCVQGSCGLGYWSGATKDAYLGGSKYLAKELGLKEIPMNWCAKK